ncbi:tetratricopeptide repeat protein [Streptomyces cylindrosporus]|uniref:Tetratricopeptide repeat protein n=1 Tax=Streptomyces cylindrosporus TaxID=2927583 RepID=A0ABS9YIB0_9ACTN|nr:tetratricopeptide repeat protein [Streptomyces cylindrosporus]MCI3276987.1 tetratricopeptide repeat protein [Streptomyces cylindrosporus]
MGRGNKKQQCPKDGVDAAVEVSDTGNAAAASGATTVTGYQGPVPGTDGAPGAVRVSGTGDAIAFGGGLANAGYIHQVSVKKLTMVQQRVPQEPAPWPHQIGVIPSRAQSFQHRTEVDRLRAPVEGGGTAVLSQVLTGMGGVGKTQLAADYARAAWEDGSLDVLVWVAASAQSPMVTGYAQAGVELCRADPDNPEQAAKQFLAWLAPKAGQRPCRWLVVLDDVADPDDLIANLDDPDTRYSLWPPASPYGRTLVTTRRRDSALFGDGRRRIEVGLFTEAEAVAHLNASLAAHGRSEPADQLTGLALDLGYLPLALAQAAAYLVDSGLGAAAYRDLLADRATRLVDTAPDRLPDEQAVPLAAAWSLSIERADTLRPAGLARPMLHLAALLDANGIPHDVLTSRPALAHLTAHRTRIGPDVPGGSEPVSPRDAVHALRALHRLSLIVHTPDTPHQAVRVHQLTQRATRDSLTPDQHDEYVVTAADALLAAWPDIERDTALAQALRVNTVALTPIAEDALYGQDTHEVLYLLGESLGGSGQVSAAAAYFRHLVDTTTFHLGPDHPDTLTARERLGYWRGCAGDGSGAAVAFADLLPDRVRVLGPHHPDTLATRRELARWRRVMWDLAGAAAILADLLSDCLRVLGPDHPDTLATRWTMARLQAFSGDAAGAAGAFAKLLADRDRVLGPDHSDTLATRREVARWRGVDGDAAGAAAMLADLLPDCLRVLGPDDINTLITRRLLARFRREAGDAVGAAAALAELMPDCLRVLGPDHNDTIITRREMAVSLGEVGDAAGAAEAFAKLLSDCRRALGPDHYETLIVRHELAYWRGTDGDAVGAADACAELLADWERAIGPDHPEVLGILQDVAYFRGEARDIDGAVSAYERLLARQEHILGPDHPDTLTTQNDLAQIRMHP